MFLMEIGRILWAWWVCCLLFYAASKPQILLLNCQVNTTNKFGKKTYADYSSLQVITPSEDSRVWSLGANGLKMKEKHRIKYFVEVETKAYPSTHITGYNRACEFWQTWKIWADLCLPERNAMTQQLNINPRHILRGYKRWKEQNQKGAPVLSRCDIRKLLHQGSFFPPIRHALPSPVWIPCRPTEHV